MSMKPLCDRCGVTRGGFIMSMFNRDQCCIMCITVEKYHDAYKEAREIELAEVKKGNTNYGGIGLPPNYAEWAEKQRHHLLEENKQFLLLWDGLTNED